MFVLFPIISASIKGNSYGYNVNKVSKYIEDLDRGVIAMRKGKTAWISWRYLITDDDNIEFNVYRIGKDNATVKLNIDTISDVTHYVDKSHNSSEIASYFVESIVNGTSVENSSLATIKANTPDISCIKIPIHEGGKFRTVWVGDLNGDGKLDFVLARDADEYQSIEAYLNDGTYLWTISLGHNSVNKNNIRPGPTTVNVGHWDGINVYDLDGDGCAEVYFRMANNVTFGDGFVFEHDNDVDQWVACVDGVTGKLKAKVLVPDDYKVHGSMGGQFGVGFLDGVRPSLVGVFKNRDSKNAFHMIIAAFGFVDGKFVEEWRWLRDEAGCSCADGHHFRIADVDGDGKEEIHEVGFTLNGNGTMRYDLGESGVGHGDRFYVAKFAKDDDVMWGYGIQQDHKDFLIEYAYDASNGEVKWKHFGTSLVDVGRGSAGDFDPTRPGLEVYSFSGLFNAKTNENITKSNGTTSLPSASMWPANNVFWGGDFKPATFHEGFLTIWNHETNTGDRLLTAYSEYNKKYGEYPTRDDTYPMFHGDILGDWREEFIMSTSRYDELIIFSSTVDTNIKLTTLWQDPGMRASMTLNGYKQSHMPYAYLGAETDVKEHRKILKDYMERRANVSSAEQESDDYTNTPGTDGASGGGISPGGIVGIIVSIIVIFAAVLVGFFIVKKRKSARHDEDYVVYV